MPIDRPLDEDPGWPPAGRLLLLLIPGYMRLAAKRAEDQLVLVRQVFVTFASALILFQVVLIFIRPTDAPRDLTFAIGAFVLGGLDVFFGVKFALRQSLATEDEAKLAASYRTRFFAGIAFSEAAALFGFVSFFVSNEWWSYPLGVGLAFLGFSRIAPTKANLAKDQAELRRRGSNLSLVRSLRQPAT